MRIKNRRGFSRFLYQTFDFAYQSRISRNGLLRWCDDLFLRGRLHWPPGKRGIAVAAPADTSGKKQSQHLDISSGFHCFHLCATRSEEHTSELKSLMRTSYAVFCLKKNIT